MKKDSTAAARAAANTKCQFKFLWGPEPCEVFYVENDECPCPKSKHRSFFARKVSVGLRLPFLSLETAFTGTAVICTNCWSK